MRLPVAAGPPVFPEGRSLMLPLNSFVQFSDQSKGFYHRKKKKTCCSFSSAASFCSHVGLQPLKTVHPLHVALDGGLARDSLSTLGEEPTSLSVAQSFALIPAWEEEMVVNDKRKKTSFLLYDFLVSPLAAVCS